MFSPFSPVPAYLSFGYARSAWILYESLRPERLSVRVCAELEGSSGLTCRSFRVESPKLSEETPSLDSLYAHTCSSVEKIKARMSWQGQSNAPRSVQLGADLALSSLSPCSLVVIINPSHLNPTDRAWDCSLRRHEPDRDGQD